MGALEYDGAEVSEDGAVDGVGPIVAVLWPCFRSKRQTERARVNFMVVEIPWLLSGGDGVCAFLQCAKKRKRK